MKTARATHVDHADAIPLGPGSVPATDAELTARLWSLLRKETPEPAAGWDAIPGWTASFGRRPDIASVELDLTGYVVPVGGESEAAVIVPPRTAAIAHAEPAVVANARLHAAPLNMAGIPLHITLDASELPVEWITDDSGELWVRLDETRAADLRAHFRLLVPIEQARTGLGTVLARELAAAGFSLSHFDLDVRARRGREVEGWVQARLRKGILSAKARARADVRIDPATMTATVTRLSVRSANPVIALALLAVRSKIRANEGRSFDLNESMPTGVRLVGLTIDTADGDLIVTGRFG